MRAVVLVGGEGTRLRPLTLTAPKQMLPVVEVTMIERVLGHLADHGVDEAVLSLGYQPERFIGVFEGDRAGGVDLTYAVEPQPMGTAGAIRFAAEAAGIGVGETFIAVNGDVLTDLDVTALVELHHDAKAEGTIALTRVPDPSAFGVVPTTDDGRVIEFVEKPPPGTAVTNAINAGTYVLEPSVLDRIPLGGPVSIERQIFPALAAEGRLYALASDAYWIDAGTPALYLTAHFDLLDGLRPPPPAPGAHLRDDLGAGVWVLGDAVVDGVVTGPALVGTAAFVHSGATVEHSVVGSGARIGAGARVRNSVLLPGAAVHERAVVDGSIVGSNAVVRERATLTALTVIGDGYTVEADGNLVATRIPAAAS